MHRYPEALDQRHNPWMREPVQRRPERDWWPRVQCAASEVAALRDIGRFQTIRLEHMTKYLYAGDSRSAVAELKRLAKSKLIEVQKVKRGGEPMTLLTLTKAGLHEIRSRTGGTEQRFYSGLANVRNIDHDIAVYEMFHLERMNIEESGDRLIRVVLERELQREVMSPLNRKRDFKTQEYQARKEKLAAVSGLSLDEDGRILFPDLRLEYEKPDHSAARVDLELSTTSYRGTTIAAKASAGMKVYGSRGIPISGTRTHSGGGTAIAEKSVTRGIGW